MINSDNDDETTLTTTAKTSQVFPTTANYSEFCIEIESSDESCDSSTWTGSPIHLFHNNIKKAIIQSKFQRFSFCLPTNEVDIKNDKFKFHIQSGDDVS